MRKAPDSVIRWLQHPRLTLASNLVFVISAAIFAGGLVGGALNALTGFPTVWLVLSAAGAGLMAASGIQMVVRARGWHNLGEESPKTAQIARQDQSRQELQRAIGRLLAELELAKGATERAATDGEWWIQRLQTDDWSRSADALMNAGLHEAHRAARIAYRQIGELNRLAKETHEAMLDHHAIVGADVQAGVRPSIGDDRSMLWQAAAAIRQAEAELEKAQQA